MLQVFGIILKVLQYIRLQLVAIIDNLKSAIEQKTTKTYLTNIIIVELLILESKVEFYNNSWIEYINKDCIIDVSNFSYFILYLFQKKIEELLQIRNLRTKANLYCLVLLSQVANYIFLEKNMFATLCELCRKSKKYYKRKLLKYNTLDIIVQNLLQNNLLCCLKIYWNTLKIKRIFTILLR